MILHSGTQQVLLSLCSVHNDEEGGSCVPIVIRSILWVELNLLSRQHTTSLVGFPQQVDQTLSHKWPKQEEQDGLA